MNQDVNKNDMTTQKLTNKATRELLGKYTQDPSRLEDQELYTTLIQELQSIQAKNDIEIPKPISEYMDEALKPIETYTLDANRPFKILDNKDTMLLRNGLITIGAEANTGKHL